MRIIRRTPRIGRALAAGALLGLAGCHQVPFPSQSASVRGWGQPADEGGRSITPAQEADVQISMGRVAEKNGDLEQAMAAYRAALSRDSRRADAYLRLAVVHDRQGKFRESAEFYRKALALRPGDPDIFCDMGYSLYLQRRWAESEANLRQAVAANPDHQRAHNNLALLLVRDNRKDEALAEFRKGGSNPAQAHMNLAFALSMDARWESARAEYERALALNPSLNLAKDRLDQLKAMVAKLEKPQDGAATDSRVLTTSTDTPSPRRDASAAAATAATTEPNAAAGPRALQDPGLVATTASVSPPRRYARTRLPLPPLPSDDDALKDVWSPGDSAAGLPPSRQTVDTTGARANSPVRSDSLPQTDAAQPGGVPSGRPIAVDALKPAPSPKTSPEAPAKPLPKPLAANATGGPKTTRPTRLPSRPRPNRLPAAPLEPLSDGIFRTAPPVKPSTIGSGAETLEGRPSYDLPALQSIP